MDPKYKNSKIYEITSNNTTLIYIGSCTISLKQRLCVHKSSKQKCSSKYIIECGDYNINLIEEYSCNNKEELRIREQYWIDKYRKDGKNLINENNAYRSEEQRLEYDKKYYVNNREKLVNTRKKYYVNNQEYYKEYRLNNREKRNEYNREYNFMNNKKICNACYDFLEMLKDY